MDARGAPQRIVATHSADQFANLLWHRRPAGATVLHFPGPEEAEAFPVPGDHRRRLNDDERGAPVGPHLGQPSPEQAICGVELRTLDGALEHGELVAQSEDLQLQNCPAAEGAPEAGPEGRE